MTDRLAPLLDRVAVLLLIGVVVAPLLLAAVQSLPPRAHVQWTVSVPWFRGPQMGVASELRFDPPWGSAIVLVNTGNEDSEDVRVVLGEPGDPWPTRPSHVDVRGRGMTEFELIPTDEGMIIDLGPMEPGESVELTLFRVNWIDIDQVLNGDEAIRRTVPPSRFDPRIRLPRWAALAGLFLLAGLAVQNLGIRRRAAVRRAV